MVSEVEIHLNASTGEWLASNGPLVEAFGRRVRVHQPRFEHMREAVDNDLRDPGALFEQLEGEVRVSNLPVCMVPGARIIKPRAVLPHRVFDAATGRVSIRELSRFHIANGYTAKSSRCEDCRATERCDGLHINMIRDQGLAVLKPLNSGEWANNADKQLKEIYPEPAGRIASGMPSQPPASSLPGFVQVGPAPVDPLAVIEAERKRRREEIKARAKREWAEEHG